MEAERHMRQNMCLLFVYTETRGANVAGTHVDLQLCKYHVLPRADLPHAKCCHSIRLTGATATDIPC